MPIDTNVLETVRPSRRSVVRGAAWSVPVVSMAATAPAFAASPCAKSTIVWSSLGRSGTTFTSTSISGVTVTLTLSGATTAAGNRTISTTQTGGQSSVLRFYSTSTNNSSQTATFSFTRTSNGQPVNVTNLSFSFLDIDSGGRSWDDRVLVNTGGFAFTIVNPTYVIGTGTSGNPFRGATSNTSADTGGSSTNGNVAVSWAASLSSVSFTYAQDGSSNGQPFIGISNMSFQPVLC